MSGGHFKHGRTGTQLYHAWFRMLERCRNPKSIRYPLYGGRGIRVCERWHDFSCFLADMGERPSPKHSLDRIDNDGNYEPGNCRWATQTEQMNNTRCNRRLEWNGETLTLTAWSKRLAIPIMTLHQRLGRDGWTVEEALSTPIGARKGGKPEYFVEVDGQQVPIRRWSEQIGIPVWTIRKRVKQGWPPDRIAAESRTYGPRKH